MQKDEAGAVSYIQAMASQLGLSTPTAPIPSQVTPLGLSSGLFILVRAYYFMTADSTAGTPPHMEGKWGSHVCIKFLI